MTCKECGGDVVRVFVGPNPVYRHATPGIDHGPLPTTRNGAQGDPPVLEPHPRSPESLGAPATEPRGARFQLTGSPWARAALLADPVRAARLGNRARELRATVGILGKSATGPWTVTIKNGPRSLQFRGGSLYGLIEFGLDRWQQGADDRGVRWAAGPDALGHGHLTPGRTLCGKPPISDQFRHPERARCTECWRQLDGRREAA